MPAPLLETKLYVPRVRPGLVRAPRLSDRLDRGVSSTLTLVSAPAGFGKTTLLAEWLAREHRPSGRRMVVAGPSRQRSRVVLDLRRRRAAGRWPRGGRRARSPSWRTLQPPPFESVLTALLNDLGAVPNDIVLVLDDYHVIEARDVHDGMAFLLDHLPPPCTWSSPAGPIPPLPLARLRARGELVEVRAADLRFTAEEAAAYLNEGWGSS